MISTVAGSRPISSSASRSAVPTQVLAGVLAAAGEADLAAVRPQVLGPAGEHDLHLAVLLVERRQHGRGSR